MNPDPHALELQRYFPFSAERVFDAWLNPEIAARWLFKTPAGEMVRAEADARVGGRFTYTERREGVEVEHIGEYLELERPQRLVFAFGVPRYSATLARVELTIVPEGSGCRLTLRQSEMDPAWLTRTEDGWIHLLEGLAATLGDPVAVTNRQLARFPGPGETRLERLLPGPIERVWAYLTESEKRRTWFAGGELDLRVGGRVEWWLRHAELSPRETPPEEHRQVHEVGIPLRGEVLVCDPPRRLTFTWEGDCPQAASEVDFQLAPEGENVRLVLTHRRVGSDHDRAKVSAGWHLHTAILYARLAGITPPPLWAAHQRLEARYTKVPLA